MTDPKRLAPPILAAVLLLLLLAASGLQAQERPLLQDGKTTIFRRIISNAGAYYYTGPNGQPIINDLQGVVGSFTMHYVYQTPDGTPGGWLRVATNTVGRDVTWMRAEDTTEFRSALTLLFSDRVNRKPLLFFKSMDSLVMATRETDVSAALDRYAKEFAEYEAAGLNAPSDFPVVAMEPESGAISLRDFYLMPVFTYDEGSVEGVKLLEVASINPGSAGVAGSETEGWDEPESDPWKFAVVVLVDTTISMGPFIEQAKNITRYIFETLHREELSSDFAFALVAFRSSVEATPGVEYVTRVISDLQPASEIPPEQFETRLEGMLKQIEEAKESTHAFAEDSLAGFETVLEDLKWDRSYLGKYIVLITDAGPLPYEDEWNSTDHTPESMADLLEANHFNVIVMHIKSRAGQANHADAERAYRILSGSPAGDLYYPTTDPRERGARAFNCYTAEAFDYFVDYIKWARVYHESDGEAPAPPRRVVVGDKCSDPDAAPPRRRRAQGGGRDEAERAVGDVLEDPGKSSLVERHSDPLFTDELARGQVPLPGVPVDQQGYYDFSQARTHRAPTGDDLVDQAAAKGAEFGAIMGYSVFLRYLGALEDVRAPQVVKSWIPDKDLSRLDSQARYVDTVEVAVVISRNQLDALTKHLAGIMEAANVTMDTASTDLFDTILSASSRMTVDPSQFAANPDQVPGAPSGDARMSKASGLDEYLADLPYKSLFMNMTQRDWYNMSAFEQDNTIRVIRSRLEVYNKIHADLPNWLRHSPVEGDWLYRMPLHMLP